MELSDVDVYDPDNFVDGVPHEMFATLRVRPRCTSTRARKAATSGA